MKRILEQIDRRLAALDERLRQVERHRTSSYLGRLPLILGPGLDAEIAGGVLAASRYSNYSVRAEGSVSGDDLDTITPLTDSGGHLIILHRIPLLGLAFTAKHATGNLYLTGGDLLFDADTVMLTLLWVEALDLWVEVARNA